VKYNILQNLEYYLIRKLVLQPSRLLHKTAIDTFPSLCRASNTIELIAQIRLINKNIKD